MASLVASRIVYAINWLNIGAIFALMEATLNVGIGGLGTLTACLYLGLGITQIPGGVLAARFGPKRVVVAGISIYSVATLAVSASGLLWEVAALRFAVGAGMALVFAPAVVLVAKLLGRDRSGLGVGLFNSAYDLGGLFGLYAWIVLASYLGWQSSVVVSGALGLATALLVLWLVPGDQSSSRFRVDLAKLWRIVGDRELILLGLGTLGIGVGNLLISGFMVYYLNKSLGVSLSVGGLVASAVVVAPIATALWGGRLYDRIRRPRLLMTVSAVGLSFSLALAAVPSIVASLASSILGGVFSGVGFTVAFAWARDLNSAEKEYDSLAIAWVNGISLTGAFVPPIFFSTIVQLWGYSVAWLAGSAFCLAMGVPVALLRDRATRAA